MSHRIHPVAAGFTLLALLALTTFSRPGAGQDVEPTASSANEPTRAEPGPRKSPHEVAAGKIADAARKLESDVAAWGGTLGLCIVDEASGRTLASVNERAPMNPASNAKLVTAATALRTLGPAHRFVTGLYGRATGDAVGELVLRGEGDPSLAARDVRQLARDLKDAGIRSVRTIAVDQSYFDDRYVPPSFDEQPNEWAAFRAPVSAVSLDENTVTIAIHPSKSGEPARVSVEPPGFVDLEGQVHTTSKREAEAISIAMEARGGRLGAKLGGHVPEGDTVRIVKRADDPRLLAGYALRAALEELGVATPKDVHQGGASEKHALAIHRSAPLAELLGALGKQSDNFYAETIFKAIAAERKGPPGSAEVSSEIAQSFLKDMGALDDGVSFKNGSGLYGADRTSAHAMATLLRAAYTDPSLGPEFVASLSIAGVDGTMRSRLKPWGRVRAVRAKTGTLNSVASLSGYVLAPGGRPPIVFAMFVNGIPGKVSAARASLDRVVDAVAGELWPSGT